ncbi:MAG: bifunctional riboflavin kinase/FAD synthetase [Gammaproteobacteria bacterium]|nr:bifunctional riboflavin kinase/FAD synthetase [Gammaproteobacteria bacterium]
MLLCRSLQSRCQGELPSVVTLGNFDGIHRGHQYLIGQTVSYAKAHHLRSVMLTFDPMPAEVFFPLRCPARLMRFSEKWTALQNFDLDELYIVRFNQALAQLSAIEFIEQILVKKLKVKQIFVGDDFHFGHKRQGDVALLQYYGEKFDYSVTTHTEYCQDQVISSTRVRSALVAGDFALVEELLGRPYNNIGRVIYGSQLGRELGCPTVNIPMRRRSSPVHGVYVVRVSIEGEGLQRYGVASVGNRPAIGGDLAFLLEVHLFDFEGDLYGKRLEVTYLHKLRDEWMFDSLDALKIQIAVDCQMARDYLCSRGVSNPI